MLETTEHCDGCRDNFYNGHNDLGVQRCWGLRTAVLITRYRLSIHTPMDQRSAYQKVTRPGCYHETGFVHIAAIPDYAR